jgi:hypothetical protein
MPRSFATPAAFKASLEARLNSLAAQRGLPINTLRLKLVMERLLARLFATPNPPWLLKGGYAMELRYRPRARTTRDIDLTCSSSASTLAGRVTAIRDQLQDAAEAEMDDYLSYRIASPSSELTGAPLGGARFPCEAFLAGKTYGRFHIDLGFGDEIGAAPETLVGDDLLAFADIRPARVLAISKPQQFAEKLHAYTFPWQDRVNTRTKDLVDLVLLIETGGVTPDEVKEAIANTFAKRGSHAIPVSLPEPPAQWMNDFAELATQVQLAERDMPSAFAVLLGYWDRMRS